MIRSSSNLACLSNYSIKANRSESFRKESTKAATKVLLSPHSHYQQDTRSEEYVDQRCNNTIVDRDVHSFYPTLEATFDSMSTLQLSRAASSQRPLSTKAVVPNQAGSGNSLKEDEEHFSIVRYLFYIFIAYYVECMVERVAEGLKRNIHKVPFLLKLECVKALVKPSNGDFGATHSLHRTQNLLQRVHSSNNDETLLSPAKVVKTSSFTDPAEEWGHFAHFQE